MITRQSLNKQPYVYKQPIDARKSNKNMFHVFYVCLFETNTPELYAMRTICVPLRMPFDSTKQDLSPYLQGDLYRGRRIITWRRITLTDVIPLSSYSKYFEPVLMNIIKEIKKNILCGWTPNRFFSDLTLYVIINLQ